MRPFVICAFYTPNYRKVFEQYLKPSLDRLKIENYVKEYSETGSWISNTRLKSLFALECLENFPEKNIVVIDVDAKIKHYPELFNCIPDFYDIGFHGLNQNDWYHNGSGKKELLTGTLYLQNTSFTRIVVNEWVKECECSLDTDQVILERIVKEFNISPYLLPVSYCYMVSLPDGREPYIKVEDPIIEHFQHSRLVRRS